MKDNQPEVVIEFNVDSKLMLNMQFSIKVPNDATFQFKPAVRKRGDKYGILKLQVAPKISFEFIEKMQKAINDFWISNKNQAN